MNRQLRHLLLLRWHMVRCPRARRGFLALAALIPLLSAAAVAVGLLAPRSRGFDLLLLAPTAYLSVAVLAVLAPLVVGGGNELFPPEQLTAYPVTARTHYAASLALTPLNLAWTTQLIALLGLTSYVSGGGPRVVLACIVCLSYIAMVTVCGQALAWFVVGLRQRPGGRTATWALAAVIASGGLAVLLTDRTTTLLDASPTTWVVIGAADGAAGDYSGWTTVTVTLVAATIAAFFLGRRACAWTLRQPGRGHGDSEARAVRRRRPATGLLREQLAVDRASVWRSPSLRRGLLVLGILPGGVAAVAGLEWSSLVLLPGLVAAGAGLLFGVNAFCLDGSGAVWLASLPADPRIVFRAKTRIVAEVCAVAVVLTVLAGSTRAGSLPTAAEAAALGCCALVTIARVVATCMQLSLTRPHRADLRGPRDTPAPPGVMAAYSLRLAASTTLLAVLFSVTAKSDEWRLPLLAALPLLLLSARRVVASDRAWQQAETRAHVVTAVATG
ncbi:MAG: hypothetical protein QOE40_1105 [Actinomycetota bacterium]|nr:hypothetical protein [Actinomycetota bacterium]